MAVVLRNKAAIFIDGRYTLQVTKQVVTELFTPLQVPEHSPAEWIAKQVKSKARIGYDPRLMTLKTIEHLRERVGKSNPDCTFVPIEQNPVDLIWEDRPPLPQTPVVLHPMKYAGQKASEKIKKPTKRVGGPQAVGLSFDRSGLDCLAVQHQRQ